MKLSKRLLNFIETNMKTKELIEELNKLDPEGNCEINFGGAIIYLMRLPWYYDGKYSILIKDDEGKIIGMREATANDGDKINVHTMTVDDLGYDEEWDKIDNPDINYIIEGDDRFIQRYQHGKELAKKHIM
jgi:hypothetical protein